MRKIVISLVLFLAIVFVILRLSELKNILDTLHRSNYRFLVAALIIELIWLFNSATDYGPSSAWWESRKKFWTIQILMRLLMRLPNSNP
jgi:hypothetical protein